MVEVEVAIENFTIKYFFKLIINNFFALLVDEVEVDVGRSVVVEVADKN